MKNRRFLMLLFSPFFVTPCLSFAQEAAGVSEVNRVTGYVGTYTKKEGHVDGKAEGIYAIEQHSATGALTLSGTVAELMNPSFVKASPDGQYLYAVSELGPGDAESGFIHAFKILPNKQLEEINSVSTRGFAPCHIAISATGEHVFVSNYAGGVMLLSKEAENGALEEVQFIEVEDNDSSNPHSVTLSRDGRQAYIADLGNNKIWIYNFNAEKGILEPHPQIAVKLEEGAGPRHLALSRDGDFIFSINELNSSVSSFAIGKEGGLTKIASISSLPADYEEKNSGADIHLHPSGKFLYVSNRGHNSIAGFRIDNASGKLEALGFTNTLGRTPRNFAIDAAGQFLYVANQDTDSISIFQIDPDTGSLEPVWEPLEVMTPVAIDFLK